MKKTLFAALAAVTVAGIALPAAAQGPWDYGRDGGRWDDGRYAADSRWSHDRYDRDDRYGRNDGYPSVNGRQADLERRIAWGVRRGTLDRYEAMRLQAEANDIARMEAAFRVNGLNGRERMILDRRLDRLESRITQEASDRDYGWGYGRR